MTVLKNELGVEFPVVKLLQGRGIASPAARRRSCSARLSTLDAQRAEVPLWLSVTAAVTPELPAANGTGRGADAELPAKSHERRRGAAHEPQAARHYAALDYASWTRRATDRRAARISGSRPDGRT